MEVNFSGTMLVKLHRWMVRGKRFFTQTISLDDSTKPCFDVVCGRGTVAQLIREPGTDQMILRAMQIDRVVVDTYNQTIDIWLSPYYERPYSERKPKEKARQPLGQVAAGSKPAPGHARCKIPCTHYKQHHSGGTGPCLMPGCRCQAWNPMTVEEELEHE